MLIHPGQINLEQLREGYWQRTLIEIDESAKSNVAAARASVKHAVNYGKVAYGINTGFGALANKIISDDDLLTLQQNIILSHCAGVGEPLDDAIVSMILLLKLNSLARGYSGCSYKLIAALQTLFNQQIYPVIPSQGSVGASGDLAPLAHMSAVLIGHGNARQNQHEMSGSDALQSIGLKPFILQPKEGLALLNGLQVSAAIGLAAVFKLERIFDAAIIAGALSTVAAHGSAEPFDSRIHALKSNPAQWHCAKLFKQLLPERQKKQRVQDPYSIRCQAQVMGACLQLINFATTQYVTEANAVSDNPLVFAETGDILSGGNFHGQQIAFAADNLALAIAEIGSITERRIAFLLDSHMSGLPEFLTNNSGVESGLMLAQVTAAALLSENKLLANPASIDSIPTSANQEDHVSMATHGAMRLHKMLGNLEHIVAIELLAASQAIDIQDEKISDSLPAKLTEIINQVKNVCGELGVDRILSNEIYSIGIQIRSGRFSTNVHDTIN